MKFPRVATSCNVLATVRVTLPVAWSTVRSVPPARMLNTPLLSIVTVPVDVLTEIPLPLTRDVTPVFVNVIVAVYPD